MRCHLGFFFELSAARSFLCPLLMKYTLASGKQALPSISASGIKRRISFGISVGIGFVRVSFIYFPLPAGKRHNRVIGYNRSWRRRNKGARREELPSGRGKAVLLCRLRAGAGMSRSAVVGQGKDCSNLPPSDENGCPLRRRPETSARQSVFWGGRFRPASPTPPRCRGVPFSALLPVGFAGGLPSAGLPAEGKRFFFKIIITNPLEFVNRALVVCFFGRAFVHNNEKSGGGSNRLRAGALTAS